MNALTQALNREGVSVARFEFPYMQKRRETGVRRPPDRMPALQTSFLDAIGTFRDSIDANVWLMLGGKSMGARVASLASASRAQDDITVRGVCCFGFPFLPPGKARKQNPPKTRVGDLVGDKPVLIVQGTRDAFGGRELVNPLHLAHRIRIHWVEEGDHDLKPRARSGLNQAQLIGQAALAVRQFAENLVD